MNYHYGDVNKNSIISGAKNMGDVKLNAEIKQTGSINNYNVPAYLVNIPVPAPRRSMVSETFEKDKEFNQRGV